jgi:hypothetical protein
MFPIDYTSGSIIRVAPDACKMWQYEPAFPWASGTRNTQEHLWYRILK